MTLLEELDLNIFSVKVQFKNFKIYEKDEKNLFFSIDKLDLNLGLSGFFSKKIKIEGLGLENPNLNIKKIGEEYNFIDIVETINSKNKREKTESNKEKNIIISELKLKNFNFEYKDNLMENKFRIKIDTFDMPEMIIKNDITFSFYMVSKGNLEIKSNIKINEKEAEIDTTKLYVNMDVFLPFVQTFLELSKFSGELSGANKIKIDLNKGGIVFRGKSEYKNLEIITKDNESLVKIDSICLDIQKMSTIDQSLLINNLKIDKPLVNFELYKKGINLLKLLKEGESEVIVFKTYEVKGVELTGGTFNFRDSRKEEKFDYKLSNMEISVSPIVNNLEQLTVNFSSNLNNETAFLKSKIDFKNKKFNDLDGEISFQNVKIDEFTHYIKDFVNISNVKGVISSDLSFKYNSNNKTPFIKIKGVSKLSDLSVIDKKKSAEIVDLKMLKLDIEEISIPENRFIINNVEIDKLKLYGYIAKDGNTMQLLVPKQAKEAKTENNAKPVFVELKNLSLKNGNIRFSDDSFKKPFNYTVDIPSVMAKNISSKKDNRNSMYKVDLVANKTGRISASGTARVGQVFETDSKFKVSNFNFSDFKEVSQKYSNFIMNKGIMNYEGSLILKNKNINSENNAKIFQIDIGEKEKILPLGISLNFVLSIIENSEEEVTLILPIEGNLSNPEFKYWKTIKIALINVFTNIAKAPFKFMNSEDDEMNKSLESLKINLTDKDLPKESVEKLEKIAKIVKKKKLLKFEFVQIIDREIEYNQIIMKKIKEKFYRENKKISEFTKEDLAEVEKISDLDTGLIDYITKKTETAENSDKMDIYEKSRMILGKDNVEQEFTETYTARNRFIENKMAQLGVNSSNISVKNATKENSWEIIDARYMVNIGLAESPN